MADRLISPGVFTQENDLSFLPQGIAQIGAVFVGPTSKGPAFRPTLVDSQEEFATWFGDSTGESYVPFAVKNYLREAQRATIVRILGLDGYNQATTARSYVLSAASASVTTTVAVIHPSIDTGALTASLVPSSGGEFFLALTGSDGTSALYTASLNPISPRYVSKVLGTTPKTNALGYVYLDFPRNAVDNEIYATASISPVTAGSSSYGEYSAASTPWIFGYESGSGTPTKQNLFRFHTLSDGNASNTDVKISIASIKPNTDPTKYGTFSVLVRRFSDTDSKPEILEQFDNVDLDPSSTNYIARRIGTARTVIDENNDVYLDGDWPNNSRYVYVEVDELAIDNITPSTLPYGFRAPLSPVFGSTVPPVSYITTRYETPQGSSVAIANNKIYYGFDFSDTSNLSYINPLPNGQAVGVGDQGFDLLDLEASDLADIALRNNYTLRKFSVPFQGGFDGFNPATKKAVGADISSDNVFGFDLSTPDTAGSRAYKLAIDILANPDAWDFNLVVLPGVTYEQHSYIVQSALDMVETRGDAFYIMDAAGLNATISTVINVVDSLDSNYAGVYYPWVKVLDTDTNKVMWVPPSVVMPAVYAFNDRVAAEWFAPAGLNRGGLAEALQVRKRLDQANRDDLYEGRVNPIAQFPAQGIAVWGQKTLQQQASALDRINVRRLLIAVKKFVASTARYLVFEQNVEATRQRFLSIVNPYLANVQERAGLYAFRVVMDETNNTPDVIDRNILVGQLYLQPAKTAEFITLEFNVLPTGATFPE